jgi:ferric-dicitrate binding protein FerR (iron transport regulator)
MKDQCGQATSDAEAAVVPMEDPLAEAARWFVALITATDVNLLWPRFEEWLRQDPRNRAAYEEMERTWSELYATRAVWIRKALSAIPEV